MDIEDYVNTVVLNARDNGYESVEGKLNQFDHVLTKRKVASYLDTGYERRFVGIGTFDTVDVGTVRRALDDLREIGQGSVRVESAGNLASMPVVPVLVTDAADDATRSTVEKMQNVNSGSNIRVPVIAEIGGGTLGSDVSLTYPVPKRRHLPRRRAVKKLVSALCEV